MKKRLFSLICIVAMLLVSIMPCFATDQLNADNSIDFIGHTLYCKATRETINEYKSRGISTEHGIEVHPIVVQSHKELSDFLCKVENDEKYKIHGFAEKLPEAYFEENVLIMILAGCGEGLYDCPVSKVTSDENGIIIEYSYKCSGLDYTSWAAITIELKRSDIANLNNVTTLCTNRFAEYSKLVGDVSLDNRLNARDYIQLKRYCFGTIILPEKALSLADVNGDGFINARDYILIKRHCFGTYVIG